MGPRINDIVGKTHKNIFLFFHLTKFVYDIKGYAQRIILLSNFRVWMQSSSIPKHGDVRGQACCHHHTGIRLYITSDQLIAINRNDTLPRSYGRYQHLAFVTMISKLRYHDLTKTDTVVTKISQVLPEPVYSAVVGICFLVWYLDYTLVHPLPVRVIKPSLTITAWV